LKELLLPVKPPKKESPAPVRRARARLDPTLATNLITALVFLCVGFVAGYVFRSQTAHTEAESADVPAPASASSSSTAAADGTLPPGHPPIDTSPEVETLEQQAAANPQDPGPPLELADLLYDRGNFQQAITWYEKAVQLNPGNVDASTDLGTCYFNVGRFDDALKQFQHSLSINPGHQPTIFNVIVVNLEGKHDYKAARQAYDALYRLNPNYPKLDELKKKLDDQTSSLPAQ
jgi:Tfp pilus assembly protein PilF